MCPNNEILSAFFDKEVSLSASKKIQNHVDGCSLCQAQLKKWSNLSKLMQPIPVKFDNDFVEQSWGKFSQKIKSNALGLQKRGTSSNKQINFIKWLSIPSAAGFAVLLSFFSTLWLEGRFTQNLNYQSNNSIAVERSMSPVFNSNLNRTINDSKLKNDSANTMFTNPSVEEQVSKWGHGLNVTQSNQSQISPTESPHSPVLRDEGSSSKMFMDILSRLQESQFQVVSFDLPQSIIIDTNIKPYFEIVEDN